MAGESLLNQIITDKFLYHIPQYRQAVRFKAPGVEITASGINRWAHAVADRLYPLCIAQLEKVLSTDYIQGRRDHPAGCRPSGFSPQSVCLGGAFGTVPRFVFLLR
jgi:hypothetical protein